MFVGGERNTVHVKDDNRTPRFNSFPVWFVFILNRPENLGVRTDEVVLPIIKPDPGRRLELKQRRLDHNSLYKFNSSHDVYSCTDGNATNIVNSRLGINPIVVYQQLNLFEDFPSIEIIPISCCCDLSSSSHLQ